MSCTICTEQFQQTQQPKVLTCGHTFCMDCLSDWFTAQQHFVPTGTLQCPLCRRNTSLPASGDGVAALPTNFALLELVEESEASVDNGSIDISITTCSIHTGKALEFSCETCSGELVCGQCVKSKHQPATGHQIISLFTAMEREQKEKAELQRKVLELQRQNSELTCSTSFAMSKPNPWDNGQTKLKTSLAEILGAKKLLKTNLSQGKSSSGLVSNPDQETAAVDKADEAVLDEIQNAQARQEQMSSTNSQQKTAVSSSENLYGQSPSDSSQSGKPKVLPKPVHRSRPHSVILSPSTRQQTTVGSSEGLYGPTPFDSSQSVRPKPVQRSRPHSVASLPSFQQKTAVKSSEDLHSPTPSVSSLSGPNVLPKPVCRSLPRSVMLSPPSQQNTAVNSPQLRYFSFSFGGSPLYHNSSARNLQSSSPNDSHCSTGSLHPQEIDTEMLSARNKLAKVLQSSLQRSPQP